MTEARVSTYVVVHPKKFLAVKGKLQHVPAGSKVSMTAAAAAKMLERGEIVKPADADAVIQLTSAQEASAASQEAATATQATKDDEE